MSLNENLNRAAKVREDEFYTQIEDVEREINNYKDFFRDKIVYCNCDDPRESAFFHYFSFNFNVLGLKKLITTCYKNQDRDLFSRGIAEKAIYLEYNGIRDDEKVPNVHDIGINHLAGDGDFRSPECIELLKSCDVVVTNPPFSLFKEYVEQLMEYNKKFIIVGGYNAITYKDIFKHIKDDKLWLGYGFKSGNAFFRIPKDRNFAKGVYDADTGLVKFRNVTWYTNIEHKKRNEELILYKEYNINEYPKYDNFDAIEVSKTSEIPIDYNGLMGVPITFMDKYNPEQFEIVGNAGSYAEDGYSLAQQLFVNGKKKFKRLIIKHRT